MPKQIPDRRQRGALPLKLDGEQMPKAMGMDPLFDSGLTSQPGEKVANVA